MYIQFISPLGPDEEARLAVALLSGIGAVLGCAHIAYALRIDTTGGLTFVRTHAEAADAVPAHKRDLPTENVTHPWPGPPASTAHLTPRTSTT